MDGFTWTWVGFKPQPPYKTSSNECHRGAGGGRGEVPRGRRSERGEVPMGPTGADRDAETGREHLAQ